MVVTDPELADRIVTLPLLAALESLRPLATEVLVAFFQQRMTQRTERAFGRELEKRAKS